MDRKTFKRICRRREPAGDEVLSYLEGAGFRLIWTPGCKSVTLARTTDGRIYAQCPEVGELVTLYGGALAKALAAREELLHRVGWGAQVREPDRRLRR